MSIHILSKMSLVSVMAAVVFTLASPVLVAQQPVLPAFSGSYLTDSNPFSVFMALNPDGTSEICCYQLGTCRPCKEIAQSVDMKNVQVLRLRTDRSELLICQDEREKLVQCPVVMYKKGMRLP